MIKRIFTDVPISELQMLAADIEADEGTLQQEKQRPRTAARLSPLVFGVCQFLHARERDAPDPLGVGAVMACLGYGSARF